MRARYNRDSLTRLRQSLAAAAADQRPEDLSYAVNELAKAQGYVEASEHIDYALNHEDGGKQAAIAEALGLLVRGPDDGWSGRTNDVRRSYFDGVRVAIDDRRWSDLNPTKDGE